MLQLAILFLLSSPQNTPAPSVGEVKKTETATPKKHFDMEDEIVIGEDARPLHDLIVKRPSGKFGSLIPIRQDFNDAIALSALDL